MLNDIIKSFSLLLLPPNIFVVKKENVPGRHRRSQRSMTPRERENHFLCNNFSLHNQKNTERPSSPLDTATCYIDTLLGCWLVVAVVISVSFVCSDPVYSANNKLLMPTISPSATSTLLLLRFDMKKKRFFFFLILFLLVEVEKENKKWRKKETNKRNSYKLSTHGMIAEAGLNFLLSNCKRGHTQYSVGSIRFSFAFIRDEKFRINLLRTSWSHILFDICRVESWCVV